MNVSSNLHHIIIVGGGAGGMELATKLGQKFGKKKKAMVTLVDCNRTHIWKPLLHEIAAGSLNSSDDEVSYMAQAYWHHFRFRLGRMDRLDRTRQEISLAPTLDDNGDEYIPRRNFHYDTLIIAVGSVANDFSIEGIREHCQFLDTRMEADRFHQLLLRKYTTAHTQKEPLRPGQLHIAIAGAGATGIELSAELHEATRQLVEFGLDRISPEKDVKITLIEAAPRILPALPERLSRNTENALRTLNINLITGQRIVKATGEGFYTEDNSFIPAEIKVWAAGIMAPPIMKELDGLETNRMNQLVVNSNLQTTKDENIFAFGDCAACPLDDKGTTVPPRAQASHQQASLLVKSMHCRLAGKPLPEYRYVDYGSLVNMSRYSTVGNLMGNLAGKISGNVMIEGVIARMVYMSLYKMHQLALHGFFRVTLITIANILTRKARPRMKLH
jgi:NADH:ubiquinone reductase (H+-translocating)